MQGLPLIKMKISIINSANEKLVGLKEYPQEKKEKYDTFILVHGFGAMKEEYGLFDQLSTMLNKEGRLVFRFDFSGCGESEGDYAETSLTKLKDDLANILEFVENDKEVENVSIIAQSMGTSVTIALHPNVKKIILLGSFSNVHELIAKLFGEGYNADGVSKKLRSSGNFTSINKQFWSDCDKYNLIEDVKKIKCPILFIHGSSDDKIPVSESEKLFENANGPKEIKIIKGADHGYTDHREELLRIIKEALK